LQQLIDYFSTKVGELSSVLPGTLPGVANLLKVGMMASSFCQELSAFKKLSTLNKWSYYLSRN
jgi:hypothetical protein